MIVRSAVVAHTSREETAVDLANHVAAAHVSVDDGTLGCTGNHLSTWRIHQWYNTIRMADWCVVLEDDAVPIARPWHDQLEDVLRNAPTPLVSLYLGQQRPPQYQHKVKYAVALADAEQAHYIVADVLLHAVAVAVRADHLNDMLETVAAHHDMPIDEAISRWAILCDMGVTYCWPSIVEHADLEPVATHQDNEPRPPGRVAYRLGQHDDWECHKVVRTQWL